MLFMVNAPLFLTLRKKLGATLERRAARLFQAEASRGMQLGGSQFSEFSLWIMVVLSGLWSLQNLLLS